MSKIKIAVIGAGHWGPNLIRNFQENKMSEVLWVIDKDLARLQKVKEKYSYISTSTEIKPECYRDVEAVVVATPTHTHYAYALDALVAGKHVLVEKPLCIFPSNAQELTETARQKNLILMVGHTFLYNNAIQLIKKYIESGELGAIYYISATRTNLGPIRYDVDAIWDLAPHDISIINYWLGMTPNKVLATAKNWINANNDMGLISLQYPKGIVANINVSWLNPLKERKITVVGSKKMLTFDDMNSLEPIRIYDKQVSDELVYTDTMEGFRAKTRTGNITIPPITLNEPLKNECDEFLNCIIQNRQPISNGEFGSEVVDVLDKIQDSLDGY